MGNWFLVVAHQFIVVDDHMKCVFFAIIIILIVFNLSNFYYNLSFRNLFQKVLKEWDFLSKILVITWIILKHDLPKFIKLKLSHLNGTISLIRRVMWLSMNNWIPNFVQFHLHHGVYLCRTWSRLTNLITCTLYIELLSLHWLPI